MSTSPLSPDDIRAAAEVHRELGPEYSDAVVASFLDKVDREIAARVEARIAGAPQARPAQRASRRGPWTGVAIVAAVGGIPLVLLTLVHGQLVRQAAAATPGPGGGTVTRVVVQSAVVHSPAALNPGWLLVWLAVVAICAAGAVRARRRTAPGRPG